MHQRITTVALYDTLGAEASKFVLNQTEMTSIAVSNDYITKISKNKIEDKNSDTPKMHRLKNLIVFDNKVTQEERDIAAEAELTVYTMEEVILKGK